MQTSDNATEKKNNLRRGVMGMPVTTAKDLSFQDFGSSTYKSQNVLLSVSIKVTVFHQRRCTHPTNMSLD